MIDNLTVSKPLESVADTGQGLARVESHLADLDHFRPPSILSLMSTPPNSISQRHYPLSPSPHSATKPISERSFDQPRTPQSPTLFVPSENISPTEVRADCALPTPANSIKSSSLTGTMDIMESQVQGDESHKRKRDIEDSGDREQKKVHVEDRRLGIEDLHLDVGKKYLLCRTRKMPFYFRRCLMIHHIR